VQGIAAAVFPQLQYQLAEPADYLWSGAGRKLESGIVACGMAVLALDGILAKVALTLAHSTERALQPRCVQCRCGCWNYANATTADGIESLAEVIGILVDAKGQGLQGKRTDPPAAAAVGEGAEDIARLHADKNFSEPEDSVLAKAEGDTGTGLHSGTKRPLIERPGGNAGMRTNEDDATDEAGSASWDGQPSKGGKMCSGMAVDPQTPPPEASPSRANISTPVPPDISIPRAKAVLEASSFLCKQLENYGEYEHTEPNIRVGDLDIPLSVFTMAATRFGADIVKEAMKLTPTSIAKLRMIATDK